MALSEEEWLACSSTNALFAALESPSDVRLSEFNFACCRRIRWLIDDDVTLRAIAAMENAPDHATIPIEHAGAVIQFATTPHYHDPASPRCDPSRDSNAAMAVGLAVCRSLPPGSSFHWKDRLDISRLVAMYCQWAVGRRVDIGASGEAEIGVSPVNDRTQQAEASAQCDLIRSLFISSTAQAAPSTALASASSGPCGRRRCGLGGSGRWRASAPSR